MVNRNLLEDLCKKEEKTTLVVNMIAKRVRQLMRGDRATVDEKHLKDPVDVAIKEFLNGKILVKKLAEEKGK